MPQAIWTGSITFGLVNVPVRLITAVEDSGPGFNMIDPETESRVHYRMFNDRDEEVDRSDLVKGHRLDTGEYVIVDPDELDELAPERSDAIEIEQFVDLSQIDPIYYDKPYYLIPEQESKKSYRLLLSAIEESGKVGIAKFVMHQREHLTAIRPLHGMLCMVTMRFAEEIRPTEQLGLELDDVEVKEKELDMAVQLIDAMTEDFEPGDFVNEYVERVHELLRAKAEGEEYVAPERPEREAAPEDLVEALESSLKAVNGG